jgi:hypothetical protein
MAALGTVTAVTENNSDLTPILFRIVELYGILSYTIIIIKKNFVEYRFESNLSRTL